MIRMTLSPEAFQIELTDADSWFWNGLERGSGEDIVITFGKEGCGEGWRAGSPYL